jgi:hypothetical protein
MSATGTGTDNSPLKTSNNEDIDHLRENHEDLIEVEESDYPIIFTDKRGIALISFVALGIAFGLNQVYPFIYEDNSVAETIPISN